MQYNGKHHDDIMKKTRSSKQQHHHHDDNKNTTTSSMIMKYFHLKEICISIISALLIISYQMQPSTLVQKLYREKIDDNNYHSGVVPTQALPRLLEYCNKRSVVEKLIRSNNNNISMSTTSTNAEHPSYCKHMIPLHKRERWIQHHNDLVDTLHGYDDELDVLFLGDSIIEQWNGTRFLGRKLFKSNRQSFLHKFSKTMGANFNGLAFGTAQDRLQHLNWHVQNGFVSTSNNNNKTTIPKIIWILIGTNNFIDGCSTPESVSSGILEIIHEIHIRKSPNTQIVIQGLLPRSDTMGQFTLGTAWSSIQKTNLYLKTMIEDYLSTDFIHYYEIPTYNFFEEVSNDNTTIETTTSINSKLFRDGVHPTTDGYDLLGQEIEAEIIKLLPSSFHR
mmetsp:Transcript_30487/g.34749  ORF Transcript_30487/g.34749 Transcript_30487/m.34749 type:complete len:390 (+) Transcript_30487:39-1208(+)